MLRCGDIAGLLDPGLAVPDGFLPPGCCGSCHEDEDFGYPLLGLPGPAPEAEVCCAVAIRWDEAVKRDRGAG